MRVVFGLLVLLLTLFVVLWLVKTQTASPVPAPVQPQPSGADLPVLQGSPQQVQEQYRQALDDALKAGQQRLDAAEKP